MAAQQGFAAAAAIFKAKAAQRDAPKRKTGPISEGGTATLHKQKRQKITGGSFTKLKQLFGEM